MTDSEWTASASMSMEESIRIVKSSSPTYKIICIKILANMAIADGEMGAKERQFLDMMLNEIDYQQIIVDIGGLDKIGEIVQPFGL